jgi:hypothetical protein
VRFEAWRRVADPVDATKDGKEGARTQPALDLLSADPGAQQLAPGDHAVGTSRHFGQFLLDSGDFHPYTGAKSPMR